MKKKLIITAALTAALMAAGVVGGTIAYFTSEAKTDISITAGTVKVQSTVELVKATSLGSERTDGTFENGGTYQLVENVLTLGKMTPGDAVLLKVSATNASDVNIKWRIKANQSGELAPGLDFKVYSDAELTQEAAGMGVWSAVTTEANLGTYYVKVELPVESGNEYQGKTAAIELVVEAVQGNKKADLVIDDENHAIEVNSPEGWNDLAALVDGGTTYNGYVVNIGLDLDFTGKSFNGLGSSSVKFEGSLNGQNHIIKNITVDYSGVELVNEAAHSVALIENAGGPTNRFYKDLKLSNITYNHVYKGAGLVVGTMPGVEISGISVENIKISAVRQSGGIGGNGYWTSIHDCSVKNLEITLLPQKINETEYDDGDKAGGIVGNIQNDGAQRIYNNTVENITIKAYRDIGAIAGNFAISTNTNLVADFYGNVVKGEIKLTADQVTNSYGAKAVNIDGDADVEYRIAGIGRIANQATNERENANIQPADISAATYTVVKNV